MNTRTIESSSLDAFIAAPNQGELLRRMRACQQTSGLDVLQHGIRVRRCYRRLLEALATGGTPEGWRVPDWAFAPAVRAMLLPDATVRTYQLFHDCGKPFVEETRGDGRRHFPGHAEASEAVWLALGGDPQVARLMRMDMDAHLLKADGIEEFAARPEAVTLLLTALAEVHANAPMFGGYESDSFKMKAKHLAKRGGQVIARIQSQTATNTPQGDIR